MGVRKSFGTNITKNHLDNLSSLFFGQALNQMGQKCPYLAKNATFGQKILFFTGEIKSFVTHITENPPGHLVHIGFLDEMGQKCRYLAKNASFGPNLAVLGQRFQFLGGGSKTFCTLISGNQ